MQLHSSSAIVPLKPLGRGLSVDRIDYFNRRTNYRPLVDGEFNGGGRLSKCPEKLPIVRPIYDPLRARVHPRPSCPRATKLSLSVAPNWEG